VQSANIFLIAKDRGLPLCFRKHCMHAAPPFLHLKAAYIYLFQQCRKQQAYVDSCGNLQWADVTHFDVGYICSKTENYEPR